MDKRRSYIIALTERGMHAIEAAGVRVPPLGDGGGYLGAVTHPARGKARVGSAEGSTSFERCGAWRGRAACAHMHSAVTVQGRCSHISAIFYRMKTAVKALAVMAKLHRATCTPKRCMFLACSVTLTLVRRVELAQLLIDEARRMDTDGRTRFHFQAPLESMDFERRVARFGTADGGATEARPPRCMHAIHLACQAGTLLPVEAARYCSSHAQKPHE